MTAVRRATTCSSRRQVEEEKGKSVSQQRMRWRVYFAISVVVAVVAVLMYKHPNLKTAAIRSFFRPRANQVSRVGSISRAASNESAMPGSKFGGKDVNQVTEGEWKTILSPEQFRILRQKGTEYPGTGKYNKFYPKADEGVFECAGCGAPLYTAKSKFDSGCGWPAFYEGIPGAILERTDADGRRTEILCAKCGGHLGHVFKNEGFRNPTNERHCVNSVSIDFKETKEEEEQELKCFHDGLHTVFSM